ncbi:MAG TPA: hypothetical protein VMV08_03105 [Gaiellaceae bacterium]|nr:hypothetical protein [Gaiellaceae bacterium]
MSRHSTFVVVAACALALTGAAAGAGTSTVAQYRAQADAICAHDQNELSALPSGLTLAAYLVDALKITQTAYTSLKKLSPPSSLAHLHVEVIANIQAGFPIVDGLLIRAKAGKLTVAQFQNDKALGKNAAAENALWTKIGAKSCTS